MGIDNFTFEEFNEFIIGDIYYDFKQKEKGNEYIYDYEGIGKINGHKCKLRVYSSISSKSNKSRKSGRDAIRVHICDMSGNALFLKNKKYRHIKRTGKWRNRLSKRITEYIKEFPNNIDTCPECNSPLKIKSGPYGTFVGCSSWSSDDDGCDYTHSL